MFKKSFLWLLALFILTNCSTENDPVADNNDDTSEIQFDGRFGFSIRNDGVKTIEARIRYDKAFDNTDLDSYLIFVNGSLFATTKNTTVKFANFFENRSYTIMVRATYLSNPDVVSKQIVIDTPTHPNIPEVGLHLIYNGYSAFGIDVVSDDMNLVFDIYSETFSQKGIIDGVVDGESLILQENFSADSFSKQNLEVSLLSIENREIPRRNIVFVSKKEAHDIIYRLSFVPQRLYKVKNDDFFTNALHIRDNSALIVSSVKDSQAPYQFSTDITNIKYKVFVNDVLKEEIINRPLDFCSEASVGDLTPDTSYSIRVECFYENRDFIPLAEFEGNISRFGAVKEFQIRTKPESQGSFPPNVVVEDITSSSGTITWDASDIRFCEPLNFVKITIDGVLNREFSFISEHFIAKRFIVNNLMPNTVYTGEVYLATRPESEPVPFSFTTLEN